MDAHQTDACASSSGAQNSFLPRLWTVGETPFIAVQNGLQVVATHADLSHATGGYAKTHSHLISVLRASIAQLVGSGWKLVLKWHRRAD